LFLKVPYPAPRLRLPAHLGGCLLCWPQAIKELPQTCPLLPSPSSLDCGLQKYNLLAYRQSLFSIIFSHSRNIL